MTIIEGMRTVTIRPRVHAVGAVVAAMALGVVVGGGGQAATADDAGGRARFEEIDVQRINIVEPDGKPRLVLTNRVKSPGAVVDGVDLGNGGLRPGMMFYNSAGDESGGLGLHSGLVEGKPEAFGQLAFDQYKQDQTLVLRYAEGQGERSVGLEVKDRPDTPLSAMYEEYKKIQEMPPGPERDKAMAEFKEKYPAPQRAFFGKNRDRSVGLTLADGKGKPRIVLRVGEDGSPRIQFLNARGEITRTIKG